MVAQTKFGSATSASPAYTASSATKVIIIEIVIYRDEPGRKDKRTGAKDP